MSAGTARDYGCTRKTLERVARGRRQRLAEQSGSGGRYLRRSVGGASGQRGRGGSQRGIAPGAVISGAAKTPSSARQELQALLASASASERLEGHACHIAATGADRKEGVRLKEGQRSSLGRRKAAR